MRCAAWDSNPARRIKKSGALPDELAAPRQFSIGGRRASGARPGAATRLALALPPWCSG